MKRFLLAVMMLFSLGAVAQGGGRMEGVSPETRVKIRVDRMIAQFEKLSVERNDKTLLLTPEQVQKLNDALLPLEKEREAALSSGQRGQRREIMQKADDAINNILNATQKKEYEAFKAQRREMMKDRMNDRRGGGEGGF